MTTVKSGKGESKPLRRAPRVLAKVVRSTTNAAAAIIRAGRSQDGVAEAFKAALRLGSSQNTSEIVSTAMAKVNSSESCTPFQIKIDTKNETMAARALSGQPVYCETRQ